MIEKIFNKNMMYLVTIKNDISKLILKFKLDPLKIFLILIFTILYLPHCFISNEDIGLMIAYKTDAGTICEAIIGLLDNYDFHDHMHSRYYGWTYYFINFIALKPIKIFLDLFNYKNNTQILIFSIKLLFFSIGLMSLIFFNEVLAKIFHDKKLYIFIGSLFYAIGGLNSIFYNIRVESTALLFTFISILCLLKFLKNPDQYKLYIYGLIALILSSLTKQIFFFTSIPILMIFLVTIFYQQKVSLKSFVTSRVFFDVTKHTILTAFAILIIINPFLIFDFNSFLSYQIELLQHHSEKSALGTYSTSELFNQWLVILGSLPLTFFYFTSVFFTYLVTIYLVSKRKTAENMIFLTMIISIYLVFTLIFLGNKLYVLFLYLAPIYPFCIIYILVLIRFFSTTGRESIKKYIFRFSIYSLLLIFCLASLIRYLSITPNQSFNKLIYHKDTIAHQSYNYISENFDKNDKIIFGPYVGLPSDLRKNSCSYWFDRDCLTKIPNPDYIMIIEDFATNGKKFIELEKTISYIKNSNMKLHHEIFDENECKISIYKANK